jgi:hypothetical protein
MDQHHHLMLINPTPRDGIMYFLVVDATKPKWTAELANTIHANLVAVATQLDIIPPDTKVIIVNRSKSVFTVVGCKGRPDVGAICAAMTEAPDNQVTPGFYADLTGKIAGDNVITLEAAWLKRIADQLAAD